MEFVLQPSVYGDETDQNDALIEGELENKGSDMGRGVPRHEIVVVTDRERYTVCFFHTITWTP